MANLKKESVKAGKKKTNERNQGQVITQRGARISVQSQCDHAVRAFY